MAAEGPGPTRASYGNTLSSGTGLSGGGPSPFCCGLDQLPSSAPGSLQKQCSSSQDKVPISPPPIPEDQLPLQPRKSSWHWALLPLPTGHAHLPCLMLATWSRASEMPSLLPASVSHPSASSGSLAPALLQAPWFMECHLPTWAALQMLLRLSQSLPVSSVSGCSPASGSTFTPQRSKD